MIAIRPGAKLFRPQLRAGEIIGLTEIDGRLIVATNKGVYRLDKNQKRWRKIKLNASK